MLFDDLFILLSNPKSGVYPSGCLFGFELRVKTLTCLFRKWNGKRLWMKVRNAPLINQIVKNDLALDNSNIDLINRLQNEYKMAFENIPEESSANKCWNWNIEMYISSLKRILYMVYDNTLAEDYFERVLYILKEMDFVAKRCIYFGKSIMIQEKMY